MAAEHAYIPSILEAEAKVNDYAKTLSAAQLLEAAQRLQAERVDRERAAIAAQVQALQRQLVKYKSRLFLQQETARHFEQKYQAQVNVVAQLKNNLANARNNLAKAKGAARE